MRNLIALLAIMLITLPNAFSQSKMKFGHIDSQELLEAMPEKAAADKKLEDHASMLESQLEMMMRDYERKVQDYQSKKTAGVLSEIIEQTIIEEIQSMEQRIQNFQQRAQSELANMEAEVYQPILDKARTAIEEVSKENGYTYVFDSSSGALLYQPEGDDILELVKKKLGIVTPPATTPATPAATPE